CRDQRELFELHARPVRVHIDVLDQRRRRFAGAHRGELVHHVIDAFLHRHLGLQKNVVSAHIVECFLLWSFIAKQSSNVSSEHSVGQDSRRVHVEYYYWNFVVHAETERGRVHYLETLRQRFGKREPIIPAGVRIFIWIAVVNPIHFGGFQDDVG